MASQQSPPAKFDRYVVIHVATTCDEHGVYVTKDSAEVIELGWIVLDGSSLDEVSICPVSDIAPAPLAPAPLANRLLSPCSFTARASWSSPSTRPSLPFAVSITSPPLPHCVCSSPWSIARSLLRLSCWPCPHLPLGASPQLTPFLHSEPDHSDLGACAQCRLFQGCNQQVRRIC